MTQEDKLNRILSYAVVRTSTLVAELVTIAKAKGLPLVSLQDASKNESFTLLDLAARQIDIPIADKLSELAKFIVFAENELEL